jgi:DNA-binding NarL/FixJ family response regulator
MTRNPRPAAARPAATASCAAPAVPRPAKPARRHRHASRSYASAAKVLPPELLAAVQLHFTGTLYVPQTAMHSDERERLVLALRLKGMPVREVAAMAGITPRRVQQILRVAGVKAPRGDQNSTSKPAARK